MENIFSQIQKACEKLNVAIIGGHTEVSYNLDRPIIVGCMLGEVEKHKLISTSGAKPGDVVILTKGIVIEGTAIIAREKREELEARGYQQNFIERCQNFLYNPGLSVVKEALLANNMEVHAMHDPTEGGLAAGLYEIALASRVGLAVDRDAIPLLEEARILCKEYNLDPLRTITSGTLLIVTSLPSAKKIIALLEENKIKAFIIGEIKEQIFGLKMVIKSQIY